LPHAKSTASILEFSITIDALEELIDRDLFFQLPDYLELEIEGARHVWP
jgi:hypothetical protein